MVSLLNLLRRRIPPYSFEQLVAPTELVAQIKQVLAEQRQRKNLLEHGFAPAHRLLLEGPPGTGKTMTAAVLATELAVPMFTVRLDSLLSKFMGETASKLRLVFDSVAQRRAVYLFDEFDALGADRSGNDVGEARRILNSFLVFLEEASTESLVLAATNHRSILDKALFRRFDAVLTYTLPDARQATAVIRARLGTLASGTSMAKLGDYTTGLSHAELGEGSRDRSEDGLDARRYQGSTRRSHRRTDLASNGKSWLRCHAISTTSTFRATSKQQTSTARAEDRASRPAKSTAAPTGPG